MRCNGFARWCSRVVIYAAMVPFGLVFLPRALVSRDGAVAACRGWSRFVIWLARWMIGLDCEIRGTPPTDECMIASKHQSFLDIIMIYSAIPRGKFIMKKELTWAPILGWFALRIGSIPVDRGKRAQAIKQMVADVAAGRADPGQLIIYPQGTRVAPGAKLPYKIGTGVLYRDLGQDCVPVAANVGVFWPKRGIYRHPGKAVIEFLPRIPAGMDDRRLHGADRERDRGELEPADGRGRLSGGGRLIFDRRAQFCRTDGPSAAGAGGSAGFATTSAPGRGRVGSEPPTGGCDDTCALPLVPRRRAGPARGQGRARHPRLAARSRGRPVPPAGLQGRPRARRHDA